MFAARGRRWARQFSGTRAACCRREAESSNTYEKQAQSQVRGDPQSIPLLRLDSPLLPPSSHLHLQHTAAASWASPLSSFSVVQQDVNKVLGRPIASGLRERFYSNTCTRRAGARQRSVTQRGARQLFNYRPASGGEEVNETRSTDSCSFISSRRRNF